MRILVACLLAISAARPLLAADNDYFRHLNSEFKAQQIGRPVIFIDLDRLDRNIDVVKGKLGADFALRVVDKSLPSVELLNYVMKRAGTKRVMAFHGPFLKTLLTELPDDTDFLMGKPLPVADARSVFDGLSAKQKDDAAQRIAWLIDTPRRLEEYLELYKARKLPLRASIEIDVGLHRGGAASPQELKVLLERIQAAKERVEFTGLMGYDGHVPSVPAPDVLGLKLRAMRWEVRRVERRCRDFRNALKDFPELEAKASVFDGGGSKTYRLYEPGSALNELALGGSLLMAKDYDGPTLGGHRPAEFIAAPLLKRLGPARLPYVGRVWPKKSFEYFYVYGGGWAEEPEFPSLHAPDVENSPPNRSLVSNESFLWGDLSREAPDYGPGDFVFYRPVESDELFLFQDIRLIRDGRLAGVWHPYPARY